MGDSFMTNEKCNGKLDSKSCDRMSSCHWIKVGTLDDECDFGTTEPPSEPGCCYGNPDAAYSSRWMTACQAFFTERDCLMLTNDDGDYRCHWEPLGEYEDCEQVWPTTTETPTVPPGCCYGDSYKSNDKCLKATEQSKCESKGCNWLFTDDPDVSQKKFDNCIQKLTRDKCERMVECFWVSGEEAVCEPPVFTTQSPTPAPTV